MGRRRDPAAGHGAAGLPRPGAQGQLVVARRELDPPERRELGTDLGLSAASVSRIVKRLLAAGLIAEEPGAGTVRGRTPTILRFVGSPGGVIAVDLGGTRCHGALADLAGSIVAEHFRPTGEGNAAVGALLKCIAALDARATELTMPVRAAVVGIPALIDPDTVVVSRLGSSATVLGAIARAMAIVAELDGPAVPPSGVAMAAAQARS